MGDTAQHQQCNAEDKTVIGNHEKCREKNPGSGSGKFHAPQCDR